VSPRIEIRAYLPTHLRRVLLIERACFAEEAYPAELFRQYYDTYPNLFLTAFRGGRLVGYSITCSHHHGAEVISIAVDPAHRRDGVGSYLLAYTINRLRQRHCQTLRLMVRATDHGTVAFYRAFGFTAGETVENYYRDGIAGLRMELTIKV
jgi:ribosomal protein S18 acetylase RimI-like enzyme